jgi:GTPase SAR1 family protein
MKKYIFKLYPFKTETSNKSNSILPDPIRCLTVGGFGSGKTTLLRNIITENWVDYKHLYVFTKNLEQPVYIILQKIFDIHFKVHSHFSDQDIVPVNECQTNSLVVFDNWILEKGQS